MSLVPQKMNINEVFSNTKYFIDFYQREYKWKKEHIENLLDDIFYRFELEYNSDIDPTKENISKYEWYYLNSFMTNDYNGRTYIVDGQQRLTTITLILINLLHIAEKFNVNGLKEVIKSKIFGPDISGRTYWMGQNNREQILAKLLDQEDIEDLNSKNITHINMVKNFKILQSYLGKKLKNDHIFRSFVIYFLTKIILVKIHIDEPKDVTMVFEVINDRGERLKPYEVFKGELLGQLDKDDVDEKYNNVWKSGIEPLELINDDEPDNFFRNYFRAKYVDSRTDYREFDKEYNKTIFSNKWNSILHLKHNVQKVKEFINKDFEYYSKLYIKLLDNNAYDKHYGEYLFYNNLNEQDRQYLLILSACCVNDSDEEEKIKLVSKLLDRHYSLLNLFGCYDSNSFTESIIHINKEIRNKPLDIIKQVFDERLIEDIERVKNTKLSSPFEYSFFKDTSNNMGIRFVRYFFSRVENYLSININHERLTKSRYYNFVRNTGHVNGYHIEHILSNNNENKNLFNNDEELFHKERNRLGALLLLKGKDNISSSNELYKDKLKTYSSSNLWNRTLISDFYHTNKDFQNLINHKNLQFKPYSVFDAQAVEERQYLLFTLIKEIWG